MKWIRLTVHSRLLGAGILLILITLGVVIPSRVGFASIRDIAATLSIILGIGLVWSQAGVLERWRSIRFLANIISDVILLSLGTFLFIARGDSPIIFLRSGLVGAVITADILFTFVPLWLRTSEDLSAS